MNPVLEYRTDSSRFLEITFTGGPYDGHFEIRYTQARSLPESVIWLVGDDVFPLLEGRDVRKSDRVAKPPTSVALYTLQRANDKNVYSFSGSVSIDELRKGLND